MIKKFQKFIDEAPTAFHAVDLVKQELLTKGYKELREDCVWNLKDNGKYFTTRNGSSIIAFNLDSGKNKQEYSFNIVESHTDSPTFKLKHNMDVFKSGYNTLGVEAYGGLIYQTMFDRPLSIAGRVICSNNGKLEKHLVNFDRDLCFIPNLAIHFDKKANDGKSINVQNNCFPIISLSGKDFDFKKLVEKEFSLKEINGMDMFLYNNEKSRIVGADNEFLMSGRIDNLASVYSSLEGFLANDTTKAINVFCAFDNEECGSMTKQGAFSTLLKNTLERINSGLNKTSEELLIAISKSFVISADNAHAFNPNYPAISDTSNMCIMNKGVAIKLQSNYSYTTDGESLAIMKEVFNLAKLDYQIFMNRSDVRGGGTLGKLSSVQVGATSVDIGIPQLAMHSSFETCGVKDMEDYINLFKKFYSLSFTKNEDANVEIR